ncbi:MAG: hypothetical protein WKF34_05820 [Pyrinomonadaceae bacterium]
MSRKTISKLWRLVISAGLACLLISSCDEERRKPEFDAALSGYESPRIVGQLSSDEITESSGLAASPCQPGVFWTHNDSGDGPYLYALDVSGKNLGVWKVTGAENIDWEDMAATRTVKGCFLYIGEIGNTEKLERSIHTIYRVPEPLAAAQNGPDRTRRNASDTEPAQAMQFKYPDGKHDAEALIVHPGTEAIYVLTKKHSLRAGVYKIAVGFQAGGVMSAARITYLAVPAVPNGLLTGASISPDHRRVIVCDYTAAYELTLPDGVADFDQIWNQQPVPVALGSRKQGEAITYSADGQSIFATSEKKNSPLIEIKRKQ